MYDIQDYKTVYTIYPNMALIELFCREVDLFSFQSSWLKDEFLKNTKKTQEEVMRELAIEALKMMLKLPGHLIENIDFDKIPHEKVIMSERSMV